MVDKVLETFRQNGQGLSFTHELPDDGVLQFLDLKLTLCDSHVCWCFSPRAKKELLPFGSAHSKTVKRGIAMLSLGSALRKSCPHLMKSSFSAQLDRLKVAGFPSSILYAVAECLLQKVKKRPNGSTKG